MVHSAEKIIKKGIRIDRQVHNKGYEEFKKRYLKELEKGKERNVGGGERKERRDDAI
jgi:uncharacterized protein YeaO (DUF488 family)